MKTNLEKYLRARRPIIWINSSDYKEVDGIVLEASKEYENKVIYEYRALGAVDFETKGNSDEIKDIYTMLDTIFSEGIKRDVFLLIKNADEEIKKPENLAYIKKIAELRYSNPNYNFTTIIVSESGNVPKEIEKFTSILDIPTMSTLEIEEYIREFAKLNDVKIDEEDIGEISISLKGLTKLEIDHVLNMMIEGKKNISISDRNIIIREKGQIIKKSAVLEIIDFKEKITDIGGLEGLKEWLESKAKIFRKLDEAKKFGVDTPKGVLLVGMPGCGKSLAAKASARLFNAPLVRLDIGRLLGKYVGESEHNMRVALKMAESISPCILWIDEIEKAFAGLNQDGGASDITKRLFGQFLTWLQEKENTVFVVATANDISMFPPEFLRKGRFDEVFFIDFPNQEERERIFEIHLEKRGKLYEDIDIEKLAKETEGYCGADIEEIVKIAIERAFIEKDGTEDEEEDILYTQDLLDAVKSIDSLSTILADKIETLKKGYERFKIKEASKKLPPTARARKKKKTGNEKIVENKDMIFVQGGKYTPKSLLVNEEKEVKNLYASKYQTTQDLWESVMNYNNSCFKGDRLPVTDITWWEALKFCNKLSEKHGLEPVYEIENISKDEKRLKIRQLNGEIVYPDLADFSKTEGYRLPTEIEWEWLARGGEVAIQDGTFDYDYSGSNSSSEVGWLGTIKDNEYTEFYGNSNGILHGVGLLKRNSLGMYDLVGNVDEYCYDTGTNESNTFITLKTGALYFFDAASKSNVIKGGNYKNKQTNSPRIFSSIGRALNEVFKFKYNTISGKASQLRDERNETTGFRVVRTAK